jgi:hypothetical protein
MIVGLHLELINSKENIGGGEFKFGHLILVHQEKIQYLIDLIGHLLIYGEKEKRKKFNSLDFLRISKESLILL